ncbi:MAG: OmpA family protein [Ascidiaceihabitans sp.]|nr:OmpA family protein [Ascidiaceihabitans sp.]
MNSAKISGAGRELLAQFFLQTAAASYNITAHTDARASDEYTMKLSYKRASSFARTTQSSGARIADVRGYCERMPAASNKTAHGMQQNYRVEIICIR